MKNEILEYRLKENNPERLREITRKIKLETDIYGSLLKELDLNNCIFGNCIDDYEILNENEFIEGYESIKKTIQ